MDILLSFLCVLVVLLLSVAVIGHGLWVAMAWIFRQLSDQQNDGGGQPCSQCGSRFAVRAGRCVVCGAVPGVSATPRLRDELTTTARQLQRLLERGAITQQQFDEIIAVVQTDLAGLAQPAGRPVSSPPPSAAPATPAAHVTAPPVVRPDVVVAAEIVETPRGPASPLRSVPPIQVASVAATFPAAPARPVHPLDQPYVPPPQPPEPPRRRLAEVVQSFMEESNIRWMEIIAAVCIVVSSVGLVWSLRSTLKSIPYFPAILFTLFTLAFHGAGLYTLRKWKLQAVSRVILVIALLLVPLSFAGAIALSGSGQTQRPAGDPLFLIVLTAGLGIFGWVSYSGSRELVGRMAGPLAVGVVGCSASQVLIHRVDPRGWDAWQLTAIATIPLGCYLVAIVSQLAEGRRWPQLSRRRVQQILLVLGIATFALAAPLTLLLVRSEPRWQAVARLSPTLSLAAAAVLALGLLIHRRTTAKDLATYQTGGTAIGLLAGCLQLLLVAFTWPEPELLLAVGTINAAMLAALGVIANLPLLYVPAAACAALAATIGVHLVGGHFAVRERLGQQVVQALLMGRTSIVLSLLGLAVSAIAGWCLRLGRRDDARMLLLGTSGLAALAVLVSLFSGFVAIPDWPQDRDLSALMLLLLGSAVLTGVSFLAKRFPAGREEYAGAIAAVGCFLIWAALVQATATNATFRGWFAEFSLLRDRPVLLATIIHGVSISVLAAALGLGPNSGATAQRSVTSCLAVSAACSLASATPFLLWPGDWNAVAVLAALAAAGWLLLAISQGWPWAMSMVQVMLALAPALLVAESWKAQADRRDWWLAQEHLLAQLTLGALSGMVWSSIRRWTCDRDSFRKLLSPPGPTVDQVLLGISTLGLLLVAMCAAIPLASWELGLENSPAVANFTSGDPSAALVRGWITLAVILAALAAALWERVTLPATVGVGIAGYAAVWLGAAHFENQTAVASAARWYAALYAVLFAAAFVAREPLRANAKQITSMRWSRFPADSIYWFGAQPLLLGGLTILLLTIVAVVQNANGVALRGPIAPSIFETIGPTASYAGPLLAIVVVLLGYALRERQAGFALGGAAVFQLAINLAFVLYLSHSGAQPGAVRTIEWLQWNALSAGGYALLWLAFARWITPLAATDAAQRQAAEMWLIPVGLGGSAAAALSIWAAAIIVNQPVSPPPEVIPLGQWLSYAAVGLFLAVVIARPSLASTKGGITKSGDAIAWLVAALVPLLAATLHRFDVGGQWIAFHTLEAGWLVIAAVACGLACWYARSADAGLATLAPHHLSAALIASLVVALAIRGNDADPAQPWWSLGAVLACCGIATALGLARRSQPYAFVSTALASLGVILLWNAPVAWPWIQSIVSPGDLVILAGWESLVFAAAALAGFWLWREIAAQSRRNQSLDARPSMPRVHAAFACGFVPLMFLVRLAYGLIEWRVTFDSYDAMAGLTTAALGGLLLAALWDRRATWVIPMAYLWGAAAWCLAIGLARPWLPQPGPRVVAFVFAVAAHVALTGQLWSYGANLSAWGAKLGISDPIGGLSRTAKWLPMVNLLWVAAVCLADLLLILRLDASPEMLPFRVAAALGPAIAAWGVLCLAQEGRRDALQLAALLVAGFAAVLLGWARLAGHSSDIWMERVFRLVMVLAALTFAYGLVLPRFLLIRGSWNTATRRAGYLAGSAAIVAFVATLVLEISLFVPGQGAPVRDVQVIAIAVVLVGLIAGLISLALLPGGIEARDSITGYAKQAYVYAAQAVAALLFAHLYVCKPLWFDGVLRPYWPFIVMALAFFGVGAAELFHRWKITVLAEPLQRTGSLLPLLPVIGWWVAGSQVDYALLLLLVGILYLALSFTRKSWAAMVAAAVAGNGALWSLFNDKGFDFTANPQLWLIPPALSVLAAAQVNRHRLPAEALTAIRYAATIVIYVSSTSQILIEGLGTSLLPPMILLGLSVAGAFAGIALRVRAFLYLGATFTLLALTSMVWHASRSIEHVWPLWAFGIFLGVGILFLLVLFEKNKTEMHQLIARLRQWEN